MQKHSAPSADTYQKAVSPTKATTSPNVNLNPGELGAKLSVVKDRLRDLGMDSTLSAQQRDLHRGFYEHERGKLQLQISVLAHEKQVQYSEEKLEQKRKGLAFARSEAGRSDARHKWQKRMAGVALGAGTKNAYQLSQLPAEDDDIQKVERQCAQAEAFLRDARMKFQNISGSLERFCLNDAQWEQQRAVTQQYELSRRWEAITPNELKPAVNAVRKAFGDSSWRCEKSTKKLCYAALHPGVRDGHLEPEDLIPYRTFLVTFVGIQLQQLLLGANQPESVIFKSYLDVYENALKRVARAGFQEFLEIGIAQGVIRGTHPVEWAERQVQILIHSQKQSVRCWIKAVCDKQDVSTTPGAEVDFAEITFWGNWRAPRFIHMKPAGNTPYDPAGAWTREELDRSEQLLEGHAERFTTFLDIDLDKIAGSAHVQRAKQPKSVRHDQRGGDPAPSVKKPGRVPRLACDFVDFAGTLWLEATHQNNTARVSSKQLGQIASQLDEKDYLPPAAYLEGRYAQELKTFNSRNSNSRTGAIKTWSQLVANSDKDHLRGMRRLLSRSAKKRSSSVRRLSGN